MICPFCKIASMRKVVAGGREIDRCLACGALWFDYGEIRELVEGRLSPGVPAGPDPEEAGPPAEGARRGPLSRMHREAAQRRCPRCGGTFRAVDFQATGIPVLHCRACRGLLAPRQSAAEIHAHFGVLREHGEKFAAVGESLARATRARLEKRYGADAERPSVPVPLPVVVPLADDGPGPRSFPVATYLVVGMSVAVHVIARMADARLELPGGLSGLPPGAGVAGISPWAFLAAPFLHAGLLPLAAGCLFLLVLGDNVEDRLGWFPFSVLYLLCGALGGVAHVLWGSAGDSAALGSAGAVAGVLGAYLVFFPDVPVRMYGLGRVATIPAYLFACFWVAASFLAGRGPIPDLFDPAPLSLAGNLAGLGTGLLAAILWRLREEA